MEGVGIFLNHKNVRQHNFIIAGSLLLLRIIFLPLAIFLLGYKHRERFFWKQGCFSWHQTHELILQVTIRTFAP